MGEVTKISWTDHTFNPWMGCTKVSPACDHCYAEHQTTRYGRVQWGPDAERVITSDSYWRNPLRWNTKAAHDGVRRRVFCASLADVFEDRPELDEHRARLWRLIEDTPNLDWQLLTKRPENITRMVPSHWLYRYGQANVWYGTTVEDQAHADERIPHLLGVPAAVRFLSCEPLLGPIDLTRWIGWHYLLPQIQWVIVGGESGLGHRPLDLAQARSLHDQCTEFGVPFFFKQVGGQYAHSGGDLLDGRAHKAFPKATVPT